MLDLSLLGSLALGSSLLVTYILFKIFSASRSPLHALPGPKRGSILFGNVPEATMFSSSERNIPEEWTDAYGGVVRVHGILGTQPELCISDPEFLHRAYISGNDSWPKSEVHAYLTFLLFGPGLMDSDGDDHKRQRRMLNPMFTVAHTRALTPSMYKVAHKLSEKISGIIASQGATHTVIDALKLVSATTLDIIGSAALGYDFNALDAETEYAKAVRLLSPTVGEIALVMPFLKPLSHLGSYSFRSRIMDILCPFLGAFGRSAQKFRRIILTMEQTGRNIYQDRQAFIANEDVLDGPTEFRRTDVLSNLVRETSKDSGAALPEDEAVAHINTLVFGGFETSAAAISRTLDILAEDQDLQDRLRTEIIEARADGGAMSDLGYDTIMSLPLLDAVVRENLRLYPPAPGITRTSSGDMVVPFALPVKSVDGKTEITEILVPKGTMIHVSVAGLNRSRAIWGEDAKEFKPERWLRPEGPVDAASKSAFERIPTVFSSLMTFAGGPRGCIGWRMAILEIKLILVVLLQRFQFQHQSNIKIKWIYAQLDFPTVVGQEATGPQLPLLVSEIAADVPNLTSTVT